MSCCLHGTMSDADAQQHRDGRHRGCLPSNALKRARTAVYLVLTSSQYQVQR